MTHRQWAGLSVISLALILVATVAGLQNNPVAGSGEAAPVPGPPAVGDCVLDPVSAPTLTSANVTGGTVAEYTAQQIRSCTAARYGEIAAVIAVPQPTVVEPDFDSSYLVDPNQRTCDRAAAQYVGLSAKSILRFWQPALQYSTALSRPSSRQEAAGQHWAACIVTVRPPDPTPTDESPSPPQYGSTLRDALHTGTQRDQLGSCTATADFDGSFKILASGCGQPHKLEIMAFGSSGDQPVSRTQLAVSCQQLTRQLTVMPDPTAAGGLSIKLHVIDGNRNAVTSAEIPARSNLACRVTTSGTRSLGGSLLALGRQPIPWA